MNDFFLPERLDMVDDLERRGIGDPRVLEAMKRIPRHAFVPKGYEDRAYSDMAIPLGPGLGLPSPFITARMLEALALSGNEHVLEVGTGTAYFAVHLGLLADTVITVETNPELNRAARDRIAGFRCRNIDLVEGNGSLGWSADAPYDAILVARACPMVPYALFRQLQDGGRMVLAVGDREAQQLEVLTKRRDETTIRDLGACALTLLVGQEGWRPAPQPA
jgi:protein-L-isoaspartate(D-aspartate) O-methyltransferase